MTKKYTTFLLLLFVSLMTAQTQVDTLKSKPLKFRYQALIIPAVLIGYGVIGLESRSIQDVNSGTKSELAEHIDEKVSLDDFTQYAPFVSVYALNAAGVQGKHNFKDRTIILGTAYLIMGATVNIIKNSGNEVRPDKTSNNSFPSGHTATAFMGAEFLYQEYKDVSVWYGISGYLVASGTGFFRMYNDRHWLNDVAAGAGIGILSTKIAYWTHPWLKKHIFKGKSNTTGMILPAYNGKTYGVAMAMRF